MDCNVIENIVLEYLEGDPGRETAKAFETHLDNCERCRDYVSFVKAALGEISVEKEAVAGASFLENVLEKVDNVPVIKLKRRKYLQTAAAAAVIIFAVFTGMKLGRFSSAVYLSQGSSIESDIFFAGDMSLEPIENYFITNGGE